MRIDLGTRAIYDPIMASLRCPICNRQFDPERTSAMPFCSEGCRWIDLRRWLDEQYGLQYEPEESPDRPEPDD